MLTEAPARTLEQLRVADVMHPGTIACPADTRLRNVARMMATYRVHAIVVLAHDGDDNLRGGTPGVISDTALLKASERPDFDELTATDIAVDPVVTVTGSEQLERAVRLMIGTEASHVIVVEPHTGRPAGVLSTLDVARALSGTGRL